LFAHKKEHIYVTAYDVIVYTIMCTVRIYKRQF